MITIKLTRLPHGEGLPFPAYATEGAAGLDIVTAQDLSLQPGERMAVPTGFAIEIPPGYEVQVRPRSGLALKHGVPPQHAGTIDSAYRGEVKVFLPTSGRDVHGRARVCGLPNWSRRRCCAQRSKKCTTQRNRARQRRLRSQGRGLV